MEQFLLQNPLLQYFDRRLGQQHENFPNKPMKKVIIDCDPGADDGHALILALYLARKHNIEILGITTVAGNASIEQVSMNAQIVLQMCEDDTTPVYRGHEKSMRGDVYEDHWFGVDGFGGYLNRFLETQEFTHTHIQEKHATDFLIEACRKHKDEVTIICTAPLTNIAQADLKDKQFCKDVRDLVILGGAYLGIGNHYHDFPAEFNFAKDPEAAKIVLDTFKDITIVPIEASKSIQQRDDLDVHKPYTMDTKLGKFVTEIYCEEFRKTGTYSIVDQMAVAVAFEPQLVKSYFEKKCYIETEGHLTRGMLVVDWYDHSKKDDERPKVKIVTAVTPQPIIDLLIEAVKE